MSDDFERVEVYQQVQNKGHAIYGLMTMTDHAMSLATRLHAALIELKNVKSMDEYWRRENERLLEENGNLKAEVEAQTTAIKDMKDKEETTLLMLKKAKEAAKK